MVILCSNKKCVNIAKYKHKGLLIYLCEKCIKKFKNLKTGKYNTGFEYIKTKNL